LIDREVSVLLPCLSALALFAVGAYSAATLVWDWRTNDVRMLVIGLGAAAIGFAAGRVFNAGE
jgi:VIT1/CCC1 family predicted Fe2+/Mn2+ transporter